MSTRLGYPAVLLCLAVGVVGSESLVDRDQRPTIPKTWYETALGSVEIPLANPKYSPVHIPADYYYRTPVRPVYPSYP